MPRERVPPAPPADVAAAAAAAILPNDGDHRMKDGEGRGHEGEDGGGGNCRLDGRVENWEPSPTADLRASHHWKDEKKVRRGDETYTRYLMSITDFSEGVVGRNGA